MPENTPDPTVHARLDQFQRQFDEITARLGRIERRLGLAALEPASAPTAAPRPAEPTTPISAPAGTATPPASGAPVFDLSSGESSPSSGLTIRPRRRAAREGEDASSGATAGFGAGPAGAPGSEAAGTGPSQVDEIGR